MSRPINISDTLTVYPSSLDESLSSYANVVSNYPVTNAYDSSNSSNACRININTGGGATTSIYFNFDCSSIPNNATITSITCSVKASISTTNSNRITTRQAQLFNGTTAKGSAYTVANSQTAFNLTTGTWTREELNNIKLRFYAIRGTNNTTTSYYFAIYGATLTINYAVNGTEYEITSTLGTNTVSSISPAGQTWVTEGNDYELSIYIDDIDNINVTDNGNDVTNQLVQVIPNEGSDTFNAIPSSFDSTNSIYDSVYDSNNPENGLTNHSSSTRCCVYVTQTANADGKLVYNFDCSSIPVDAIITDVSCIASAACYSNGQYFDTRVLQLYSGNTAKGSPTTITGNGNTRTEHTINGGSSWTRNELNNINIVIYIQRGNNTTQASFSFWGATLTVEYTLPSTPYYKYTLTNINDDHIINIVDAIIEIPEEDPQYDYYNLTISSINATTDPGRGTIRIVEGSNQSILIYPDDPLLTLATDNGVDITSQLVQHSETIPQPTVSTASGATYGFTLNNSGYYESTNKGIDKSAAVCVLSFDLPVRCLVTIQYINYAEATYDFGIFGNIDVALTNNYKPASGNMPDSNYKLACNMSEYNKASIQTITYEIPSGQHNIYIKFTKDDATSSNNDTLQFKVSNIEALEANNYYEYSLSNISTDHSLIFVFGNVTYYFANSSGTNAKLYPSGSMIQLPGDNYRLVIVPDDYSYVVTVKDNNVDVTSSVQRKEEEIIKNGETITVVNYIYSLSNIQTTHNIIVECRPDQTLFIKVNGSFIQVSTVYKKVNGSWVEQNDYENLFDNSKIYIKN